MWKNTLTTQLFKSKLCLNDTKSICFSRYLFKHKRMIDGQTDDRGITIDMWWIHQSVLELNRIGNETRLNDIYFGSLVVDDDVGFRLGCQTIIKWDFVFYDTSHKVVKILINVRCYEILYDFYRSFLCYSLLYHRFWAGWGLGGVAFGSVMLDIWCTVRRPATKQKVKLIQSKWKHLIYM